MYPKVLVNGKSTDVVSVFDRGLLYGDGVFETIAVHDGSMPLWSRHWQRLEKSCNALKITPPNKETLQNEIFALVAEETRCVVKIIITRGQGPRGYRAAPNSSNESNVTQIIICDAWPDTHTSNWQNGINTRICELRLSSQSALCGMKHLNRLENVMARSEWTDDNIEEGLLFDHNQLLIEATSHNIFIVKNGHLITPDLSKSGVRGVMRDVIIDLTAKIEGIRSTTIASININELLNADEVFICNSLHGIWPVTSISEIKSISDAATKLSDIKLNVGEVTLILQEALQKQIKYL